MMRAQMIRTKERIGRRAAPQISLSVRTNLRVYSRSGLVMESDTVRMSQMRTTLLAQVSSVHYSSNFVKFVCRIRNTSGRHIFKFLKLFFRR